MRFFLVSFRTSLSELLRSRRTWVFVLLLPALTLLLLFLMPPQERTAPVTAGVCLPHSGGEQYWALLEQKARDTVSFVQADEDTLQGMVAAGVWDCGLILPEDFAARAAALDTRNLVTLVVGQGSAAYPLVRETAAAALLELISPDLARDYLLDSGIASPDTIHSMEDRLQQVLPQEERVSVQLQTADGSPLNTADLADSTLSRLLQGLTAVLLLLWAMFLSEDLGSWRRTPAARRTAPLTGIGLLLLPRALASALPVFLSALCTGLFLPNGAGSPWAMAAWMLFLLGASLLAARCPWLVSLFPLLAPAIPLLALLTSPILLDPALLFPALEPFCRWNPLTLYLEAAGGSLLPGILLAALGLALAALSLWLPSLSSLRRRFPSSQASPS